MSEQKECEHKFESDGGQCRYCRKTWIELYPSFYPPVLREPNGFGEPEADPEAVKETRLPTISCGPSCKKALLALDPFKSLADKFDHRPYNDGYTDQIRINGEGDKEAEIVRYHNFLTLGDCRQAKAAFITLERLLSDVGGKPDDATRASSKKLSTPLPPVASVEHALRCLVDAVEVYRKKLRPGLHLRDEYQNLADAHDEARNVLETLGIPRASIPNTVPGQMALLDWLKPQCSRLLYGECSTLRCLKRGGWDAMSIEGRAIRNPTCEPFEIFERLCNTPSDPNGTENQPTPQVSPKDSPSPSSLVEQEKWTWKELMPDMFAIRNGKGKIIGGAATQREVEALCNEHSASLLRAVKQKEEEKCS